MTNPGPRSPQLIPSSNSSPSVSHRQSFADNLRGMPTSPRASRQPSLSQQALQDLLNNPPVAKTPQNAAFQGRDWRSVKVGEVIDPELVRFVEIDTSVEEATNTLISSGSPNVVLLRENKESHAAIGTFDYSDLNAYLLLVVGLARPEASEIQSFNELAQKGREGKPIPLKDVKDLGKKEPLITLPHTASLTKAVEIFGSGIHRIIIVKEHSSDVIGILTQLRLMGFFWQNGRNFPSIEQLYPSSLRELNLGSQQVIAINGDKPVTDALELMHNEGITSLPVLDNQNNVVGNISHVDVRLLTKTTALPLLRSSCIHFISVILSERGMNDGKDSFPVFHVTPQSTLAHTVAKLVATKSHRMWITTPPSPASSGPPTPAVTPAQPAFSPTSSTILSPPPSANSNHNPTINIPPPLDTNPSSGNPSASPPWSSPHHSLPSPLAAPSISASAIPGASLSGHLTGVVSLTDILNLFARASGLSPHDPNETRRARRRSSSVSVRSSFDSSRDIAGKR
ncbi:Cystathionine beta-synthase core [Macrophomina phaseolina MS6]|uniref:Protein SDS23 n=1 Tax=Macrophomina phaseolina (strain MS6) TaxID=1126212 RepID=K2RCL9_MACPH|nr:Cystathionine beta-synthase core [Macrophomina phaseolina MS6]